MPSLLEAANLSIPLECGIRDEFCAKISALGIDLEGNEVEVPRSMDATVFLLPEKGIVIKFFQKEPEASTPKLPNKSRAILQPYCHCEILGNLLAVFPLLNSKEVTSDHIHDLREQLKSEGYVFWDDKRENVALADGMPFVIDRDAVFIDESGEKDGYRRPDQWSYIDPRFPTDYPLRRELTEKLFWKFNPLVEEKMFAISGASAHKLAGPLKKLASL